MPRKPRFYQQGVPVHVFHRGHNKDLVFFDDEDYLVYLRFLKESAEGCGCLVHAYVLMTNHAHLLVTPESSKAISALFQGIEAIKFRMEQQGLTQKDLDPYIGSSGHVSERNGLSLLYCPIG